MENAYLTQQDAVLPRRLFNTDRLSAWLGRGDSYFRYEPVFRATALFLFLLLAPLSFAAFLDGRMIAGENIWIKPIKFAIAMWMYLITLAFYARWLPTDVQAKSWYKAYSRLVATSAILEMLWIGGAAFAGTTSHFNFSSTLMIILYAAAGLFAVILTSASLVYGVLILRDKSSLLADGSRLSLGLGLVLTFILTVIVAGFMSSNGSHFVGTPLPGDTGAWIFGWSESVGDLRVAHFFATHALHVVPIIGLLTLAGTKLEWLRMAAWATALVYSVFVLFTFVQALMGRPFI